MTTRPLVVITAIALAAMTASSQERPAGFQDMLRKGDVAGLTTVIDTDPAIVNRLDAQGMPPLCWATFYGQKGIVELLLARGANARVSTPLGTAVHAAVYGGHPEMVTLLAAAGADLNDGGVEGNPPLVSAAERGALPVVEALVEAGASIAATDRTGDTALLIAASFGHEQVLRFLLAKGANPNTANSRGDAPLDVARRQGHTGIAVFLESRGAAARSPVTNPTGPFLGQTPPGATARLFAPSIVSTERRELNIAFTPDGKTVFFSRDRGPRGTVIMVSTVKDGRWTTPEPAPFSRGGHSDVDMFVTRDGREIYFCSDRPVPGALAPPAPAAAQPAAGGAAPPPPPPLERSAIWVVTRTPTGWTEPAWLGPVISSGAADYYPTLTSSDTLYFSSNRPGGLGQNDIYRARRVDGKWLPPENLGSPVSSRFREFDPFVAPDESYLIFASNRPGGLGASDLYVSFRDAGGAWTEPRNLGPAVNTAASEYTPMLSPDGKYLFFTSSRESHDDLFWIDSSVIASLHPGKVVATRPRNAGGEM